MIGCDAEFANFIQGRKGDTCLQAAQLLLSAIPGVPAHSLYGGAYAGISFQDAPTDTGRKFLAAGSSAYIDLAHIEMPTAEVLSALDFTCQWRATIRRLQLAMDAVNAALPEGERVCVLANNSDGRGNSWASHLNVLMTETSFRDLFRKPLSFLWLATFHVSSLIFTGAGKVGSENGQACDYQLAQRGGDFFTTLLSWDTTYRRGLINQRDEGHATPEMARLHCIFYDSNLADYSTYLKVGAMQLAVAMLEADFLESSWILEDPLAAATLFSHDVSLSRQARTFGGWQGSALDLQYGFLEQAGRFVARGHADGIVPDAANILSAWSSTLDLLRARDFARLSRRLDWVLKLAFIERAVRKRKLTWTSPEVKALDHMYANLDETEGLFLAAERAGLVDRLADPAQTELRLQQPPEDTRAYTRGRLLAMADPLEVVSVDWNHVEFLLFDSQKLTFGKRRVDLSDPLLWGKKHASEVFRDGSTLEQVIDGLQHLQPDSKALDSKGVDLKNLREEKHESTYKAE
jgi:proteasome accessory factor A